MTPKFPFSAKDLEILRFKIDEKMEFENHMDNVCRKVSADCNTQANEKDLPV